MKRTTLNCRRIGRRTGQACRVLERLEPRLLLSAAFPTVTQTQITGGTELAVTVSGGEQITLSQSAAGITVTQAGTKTYMPGDVNQDGVINFQDLVWVVQNFGTVGFAGLVAVVQEYGQADPLTPDVSNLYSGTFAEICVTCVDGDNTVALDSTVTDTAVLRGGSGNDTLIAGAGNTTLYAGTGQDTLIAGAGADTLVALGASADTLQGGTGIDSYWVTAADQISNVSAAETALKAVHLVTAIPGLASPAIGISGGSYTSFASDPLFSSGGPMANDVVQGDVDDCWYLATLAAIAQTDQNQIRQDIVELSDGTFLVRFVAGLTTVYEHVDSTLPTNSGGLVFAKLGADNSLWVALLEKAFAAYRYGANSYTSLGGGWMNEAYNDLGIGNSNTFIWSSATALLQQILNELNNGEAVTAGVLTVPAGVPVIASHAYTVVAVTTDDNSNLTGLELRNPWGFVGVAGYAANNGNVTITAAQALAAIAGITAGVV